MLREDRALRLGSRLTLALFLYLPMSMPWVVAQMYLTNKRWSSAALLARPETWLLAALVACAWASGAYRRVGPALRRDRNLRWLFVLAGVFVGWTSLCAVIQGAYAPYWVPYLLVGWVLPAILALTLLALGEDGLQRAWTGLRLGIGLLLAAAFLLYFASFGLSLTLLDILVNRYNRAPAGMAGGVYFARLTLGDYNSVGIFFAAVAAFCLGQGLSRARARTLVWVAFLASLLMVYLVYSRGTIISVVVAALALLALAALFPRLRTGERVVRALLVLALFGVVVSRRETIGHWGFASAMTTGSGGVRLGMWGELLAGRAENRLRADTTEEDRAKQDATIQEAVERRPTQFGVSVRLPLLALKKQPPPQDPRSAEEVRQAAARYRREAAVRVGSPLRRYVFGVGVGNYGLLNGMSFDTGTHSLFLDAFAASGLAGIGIFILFWCALGWRLWRGARALGRTHWEGRPEPLALLLAFLAVSVSGVIVNFRLDGLGIMLPASCLWLMALSVPPEREESGDSPRSRAAA